MTDAPAPAHGPPRIVGLGESLLRLSPPGHQRLDHATGLDVEVGGAEMNALIAAAGLGLRATWISRLADNPLGHRVAAHARAFGVDVQVDWDPGARAALYFVEQGVPPRPSEVLYDRSGTAMRRLTPDTFDWTALTTGAGAVLTSGITCALGAGPAAAATALLAAGRGSGAVTAFDVNHRARLWTWDEAVPVLRGVLPHVDVLLAGRGDLLRLLPSAREDESATALAHRAIGEFGHELVVLRRTDQLPGRRVAARVTVVTAAEEVTGGVHEADVVDAFGAGDAALGVLLAARLAGDDGATLADKAAWAGAFQHTMPGDACRIRPADLARRGAEARRILR
ncbi:sugar kinase [Actinomadura rugatobispora]|uniref:Sugar kinase n=1 Tax=Actinomadura rugatobispora TaxID=1994 RepID=A0ABW1A547_9ACTN|nr:bifunctional 2-dehydro-3-deoxygluconokinase/2-dehydro-3-deoxygalactonoki nase [Actinomadura rugatobispora]